MKKLEDKIPELQAKLRKHMKQEPARAGSSGADGLTRRVEVLEDAVDTLLDAEVCLSSPLERPLIAQPVTQRNVQRLALTFPRLCSH